MNPAKPRSLARRIALYSTILATLFVLLAGAGAWVLLRHEQRLAYEALLAKELELEVQRVSAHMQSIHGQLARAAASSLISTALVDSAGKDAYLVPYLQGLRRVEGVPIALVFTDFEAKEIARNGEPGISNAHFAWLAAQLAGARRQAAIFGSGAAAELVVAEYIYYSRIRTPEGALLYRIRLSDLVTPRARLHWANDQTEPRSATLVRKLDVPQALKPLDFAVELTETTRAEPPTIWPMAAVFALAVLAAIVLAQAAGRGVAERLTRDLRDLSAFTGEVVASGFGERRAVTGDTREVAELAAAVNTMLDRLNALHRRLQEQSEQKYRTIFEESFDGLFITSVDGKILEINKKGVAMLGYGSKEEMRALDLARDVYATAPDRQRILAMVDEKGSAEYEVELKTKSGERLIAYCSLTAVRGTDGKIDSYRGIIRDITERKRAENAIRESEERLRLQVERMPIGLIVWSPDFRVQTWNPAAERIFGYGASEALGRHPYDLIVPKEAQPDIDIIWSRLLAGDQTAHSINENTTKDGRSIVCEWHNTPLRRPDGSVGGALSMVEDVTARRLAEQKLRESEAHFRFVSESAQALIWMSGPDKLCTWFNKVWLDFTGRSMEQELGEGWVEGMHPNDRQSCLDTYRTSFERREPFSMEYRLRRRDGEYRWVLDNGAARFGAQGEFEGYIGSCFDITERKRTETALARSVRALRTLSACNEALVRSKSETDILNSICRLVVETGGYRLAWVGHAERDDAKTVRPIARYGFDDGYLDAAGIVWADTERGAGPTGVAIRSGTAQVNQDTLSNPRMAPWREASIRRGYGSSIALPLNNAAGTYGVLTIYAQEADAFSADEVALLRELADDLAFGIDSLRTRAERDRIASEHLHHQEILRQSLEDSIKAIAATVEMRDPYTAGHQRRVGQLAVAIARELGLPAETIHGIDLAASIHDLGKINIPAEILVKPTRLTDLEYRLIQGHAQAGYDILKGVKFLWPIATMVWQHHERLDGSGYPQGLKADAILLESRIMAVADVVEAMASHRPYRPAVGIDAALQEIERGAGRLYDAAAVAACVKLFRERNFQLED